MTTTFKRIVPTDTYEVRVDGGVLVGTVDKVNRSMRDSGGTLHNHWWDAYDIEGHIVRHAVVSRGYAAAKLVPA